MNEKLQYAQMLEIPTSTCSVHFIPTKRKKRVKKINNEEIKNQLIEQVNNNTLNNEVMQLHEENVDNNKIVEYNENLEKLENIETVKIHAKKKSKKINIIAIQFIAIGVLVLGIFLTNVFLPQSGINSLVGEVFGVSTINSSIDTRDYTKFQPTIMASATTMSNGVIMLNGKGSVYCACDGKVSSVKQLEDNTFEIEVLHSNNFKSVLYGLNSVYCGVGDKVYKTMPVGYTDQKASMCFYNDGSIITDYSLINNKVVWAV